MTQIVSDLSSVTPRPKLHTWTRHEYQQLVTTGLFHTQRVELIEGQIIDMSPMGSYHATAVKLVDLVLQTAYATSGYFTRCQLPLSLGNWSEPEPDVAVIRGNIRDFTEKHPQTALLVVEIADTTLEFDRVTKGSLYAKAGIPQYWLLNLGNRSLEIYQYPEENRQAKYGYAYRVKHIKQETEWITLPELSDYQRAIADILP